MASQDFGAEGQQKHRKDYLSLFLQLCSGSFGENREGDLIELLRYTRVIPACYRSKAQNV